MPEQSLGQIILRLIVDNKAFKEGLVNALQLVQITSTQIKDLTNFKIAAPDIKALDLALETGEARVRDFIGAQQQILPAGESASGGLGESGKKHEEHAGKVQGGEQALRGFFREQRLQDRTLGTARNSLLALTGSFIPFIAGSSAGGGAARQLGASLSTGLEQANAMEFALFGLGQVGGKLPGVLGSIATGAASMAGPIAAAVGVGALLIAFFRQSNEEAQKAVDEGLKNFTNAIENLSRPQRLRLAENIKAELDKVNAEIAAIERVVVTSVVAGSGADLETQKQQAAADIKKKLLKEQAETLKEMLATEEASVGVRKVNEEQMVKVRSELQKQDQLIKNLRQEIETRVDLDKKTELSTEAVVAKQEQLTKLERERAENLRTSLERAKDFVTQRETELQVGRATTDAVIAALQAQRAATTDKKEQLAIDAKIQQTQQQLAADAVTVAEARRTLGIGTTAEIIRALEAQQRTAVTEKDRLAISEKILSVKKQEADTQAEIAKSQVAAAEAAFDKFDKIARDAGTSAFQNQFEKQSAVEQRRHEETLKNIEVEFEKNNAGTADIDALRASADKAIAAENAQNTANNFAIEKSRQQELNDFKLFLLGSSSDAAIARINQTYDAEREKVRQIFADKDQQAAALGELEKRRKEDVEAYKLNIELDSVERLGAALQQAFNVTGDSFIGKLLQALQVAIKIARTLEAAKVGGQGGRPLDVLSSFIGIFALFAAEGGELPGGSYVVNEQASKKYKPVLDALGAGEVRGGVAGKDSVLARGEGGTGGVLTPGERIVPAAFSPLARAINEGKIQGETHEVFVGFEGRPRGSAMFRAGGGPLVRKDYLAELMSTVREYVQVNPTFSSFPLPSSVIESVRLQMQSTGGFNKEVMDALIEEVRGLREEVRGQTSEIRGQTSEIRGQRSDVRDQEIKGRVDIDNGKMFFRKHLPGALDFDKDKGA